ncbi:MAG: DinB family protein, partial [Candidatus Zixiibacteriota bacterium]
LTIARRMPYCSMVYRIGVNDIEPNHWVAWVFDLHGCFAKAKTHDEAVASVPETIKKYFRWLKSHNHPASAPKDFDVLLAEDIKSPTLEDGYIANALFEDDRRPLTTEDADEIRQLLVYTRKDLHALIDEIPPDRMDRAIEGEVQTSVRGILNHIATAEWWYFDRIDMAFDRKEFTEDVPARLDKSRDYTISMLPALVGVEQVVEKRSEKWSARKVMRRTLWHEIAHTSQIRRYLGLK